MTTDHARKRSSRQPWLLKYLTVLAAATLIVVLPLAFPAMSDTAANALRALAVTVWAGGSLYVFLGEAIREKMTNMYPQPIPRQRRSDGQRPVEGQA